MARAVDQFATNRESVRSLMHFDKAVLDVVVRRVGTLNEKWKSYLLRDAVRDKFGKLPPPNAQYTADGLLQSLATIRQHDSLRVNYDFMLNQCLVLLVSFFGSAARALCTELLIGALKSDSNPAVLRQELTISVDQLRGFGEDWESAVGELLVATSGVTFQDMKSMARVFGELCGYEPSVDEDVRNIIVAQACRHAIVHAAGRVDPALLRQVAGAHPRTLKPDIGAVGEPIRFTEEEIEAAGDSMMRYLQRVAANAA